MSDENRPRGGVSAPPDSTFGDETRRGLEEQFELLTDARRRYAIDYLREQPEGVAQFEDLVETLLAREGVPDGRSRADSRERLAIDLHHVHVPMLIDAGVVEYDWRNGTVRYRSDETLERLVCASDSD